MNFSEPFIRRPVMTILLSASCIVAGLLAYKDIPIAALPQLIFANAINVQTPQSLRLAWGAALVLVAIILLLNIVGRVIAYFGSVKK